MKIDPNDREQADKALDHMMEMEKIADLDRLLAQTHQQRFALGEVEGEDSPMVRIMRIVEQSQGESLIFAVNQFREADPDRKDYDDDAIIAHCLTRTNDMRQMAGVLKTWWFLFDHGDKGVCTNCMGRILAMNGASVAPW